MKKSRWFTRAVAVLLCAAMLVAGSTAALIAQAVPGDEAYHTYAAVVPQADDENGAEEAPAPRMNAIDWFFSWFNWFGFTLNWDGRYVTTQRIAWQWLFGFNQLWESFAWAALVFPDSMAANFHYDDMYWMVKFWKGSYAAVFATGGEIGVYNRWDTVPINHYFSARASQELNMTMTIYRNGARLFTRPMERTWWMTGFMPAFNLDMFSNPRSNVIMDATVEFLSYEMREAFVNALPDEFDRFDPAEDTWSHRNTDVYWMLDDGLSVRILWQNYNGNWF